MEIYTFGATDILIFLHLYVITVTLFIETIKGKLQLWQSMVAYNMNWRISFSNSLALKIIYKTYRRVFLCLEIHTQCYSIKIFCVVIWVHYFASILQHKHFFYFFSTCMWIILFRSLIFVHFLYCFSVYSKFFYKVFSF